MNKSGAPNGRPLQTITPSNLLVDSCGTGAGNAFPEPLRTLVEDTIP